MAKSDATATWSSSNFESIDPFFPSSSLDDADDWGEFMMTPNGFNHTFSHPVIQSAATSSMNPIQLNLSDEASTIIQKDANANRWEKIKGAIPLSIFGLEGVEIGKGELNGSFAEKSDGVKKDMQLGIDQDANNVKSKSNGPGEVNEASAGIPNIVNRNVLPEREVLSKGVGDNFKAKYSDLFNNQLNWNPLALKEKATGFESLQNLNMLENGDNPPNFAASDADDDGWEFKNAEEVKRDAGNNNVKSSNTVSQKEGQIYFGKFDSLWPSVSKDFGESISVVNDTNTNWFDDDTATGKVTPNGNNAWHFHSSNLIGQTTAKESLEENVPGIASPSIVSSAISGQSADTFESTEVKIVNSNATVHNLLTEANGEEEEWSFQVAKLDDSFELHSWDTPHSSGSAVKEENTVSTNGVGNDLWAQELWDFQDSVVSNLSSSKSYEIPANEKSASPTDSDGSQLLSSLSAGRNFSLDANLSAETGKSISSIIPRGKGKVHSFFSPDEEIYGFEENSWAFVGPQASENEGKALSREAREKISDMIPGGNGENHSFSLPNAEALVSKEDSWSFFSAEASGNMSEGPHAETREKNFSTIPHGNEEIISSLLSNDESAVFEEKSWAFVGAEASENKRDAIGTPTNSAALPLSLFGEEETELDSPVLSEDNSKSKTVSRIYHTNDTIEDIVASLYNQMEHNSSTKQSINDTENGTNFLAEVNTLNQPNEVCDPDDYAWEFHDANKADQNDHFTAYRSTMLDDEYDEYVDMFERLRAELNLRVHYHLEHHETERINALDADSKESNDLQVEIPGKETSQEFIIPNGEKLSEMLSKTATILNDPKFKLFESDYSLSRTLNADEEGLEWCDEVLKDVIKILRILKLATKENRKNLVGVWSKILAACLKELRHGASIWKDLIEMNAHHTILLESRGKDFVMSLREIHRVVEIIKVSSKIYKPWLCTLPLHSSEILSSIDECIFEWSSCGLQEAYGVLESGSSVLLESDTDSIFECEGPICQLSLLPESAVPGAQMVVWNGKYYFLNLANLWANLVDCQPPMLPALCFASI